MNARCVVSWNFISGQYQLWNTAEEIKHVKRAGVHAASYKEK